MSLTLEDVSYILFRHKFLIAVLLAATGITAYLVNLHAPVTYVSTASVMVKYVQDTTLKDLTSQGDHPYGEIRQDVTINNEIEIMRSADLAANVVDALTPAKILGNTSASSNRAEAIAIVRTNLEVKPTKSEVINLQFTYSNPDVVQPVMTEFIHAYQKRHDEIHNPAIEETLTAKLDAAKGDLTRADTQLRALEAANGGDLNDDSAHTISVGIDKLQAIKEDAESDYASDLEKIRLLRGGLAPTSAGGTTNDKKLMTLDDVPLPTIAEFKYAYKRVADLETKLDGLRGTYTDEANEVKSAAAQVAQAEKKRDDLIAKYPVLATYNPTQTTASSGPAGVPVDDPRVLIRKYEFDAKGLEAKIATLNSNISLRRKKLEQISSAGDDLDRLKAEKSRAEKAVANYADKLQTEQIRKQQSGFNISVVESPQPAGRFTGNLAKVLGGIIGGGVLLAFGIPFLIELVLDRSLKRPADTRARLGQPFFMTIPLKKKGLFQRQLKTAKPVAMLNGEAAHTNGHANGAEPSPNGGPGLPAAPLVWEENSDLIPFHESLRDQLMTYFEMINLTHKPKLVAVTSCGEGSGVTTTAAGLASSLSETGDGNVLLVNMNARDGEAHHFYKGKLTVGLDQVLEKETRQDAFVQGNLYMAKERAEDERLPRVLPKRFNHLLPKMRASDFDYIIFDMPPVSQISITPRLARFMDMVLLVIESGKTNRDAAKHATDVLTESKTNVGVILNKNKDYLPRWLQHEL